MKRKDGGDIWVLCVCLICWVDVVVLLSAIRTPFLKGGERFIEDFLSVDGNQATIIFIRDTTTVVTLGDHVLNGSPWRLTLLPFGVRHQVNDFAHADCKVTLTNIVIGLVESV